MFLDKDTMKTHKIPDPEAFEKYGRISLKNLAKYCLRKSNEEVTGNQVIEYTMPYLRRILLLY